MHVSSTLVVQSLFMMHFAEKEVDRFQESRNACSA